MGEEERQVPGGGVTPSRPHAEEHTRRASQSNNVFSTDSVKINTTQIRQQPGVIPYLLAGL